jgi:hypothetical protein
MSTTARANRVDPDNTEVAFVPTELVQLLRIAAARELENAREAQGNGHDERVAVATRLNDALGDRTGLARLSATDRRHLTACVLDPDAGGAALEADAILHEVPKLAQLIELRDARLAA